MLRSAIGDVYFNMVLDGRKKFSEVHSTKQKEVAEKLITAQRCDLIDISEFHQPHEGCLFPDNI